MFKRLTASLICLFLAAAVLFATARFVSFASSESDVKAVSADSSDASVPDNGGEILTTGETINEGEWDVDESGKSVIPGSSAQQDGSNQNTKKTGDKRPLKIAAGIAGLIALAALSTFLIVRKKPRDQT